MSNIYPFCPLLCGIRTNFILEHIKKCKNKALLGVKYMQCPYNPRHIFGKKVFQMHVDRCPDRFKKKNKKQEDKSKKEEENKEEIKKEEIEKEEKEEEKEGIKKEDIEKEEKKEEIEKEEEKEENEKEENKEETKKEESKEEIKKEEIENDEEKLEIEKEEKKEENKEEIEKEEKKEETKKEEIEKDEKNNGENIFIEEEENDDEEEGFIRSAKRHLTSINLDRYSHNKTLRILLSRPDDKNPRKQSENIINQLYLKKKLIEKQKEKEEKRLEEELNLIKKKKEEEEFKKIIPMTKNNSSSHLRFKGILKHKRETEPQLRKTNSSYKTTFNTNCDKEKEKSIEESLIHFNETDSENSEEISPRYNNDYKRKKRRSVTFKGFVKVFVFDGKKKKRRIPQRSAFANSKLKKEPENQNDNITEIYMKSL